jgi:hypothetical protein
MTAQHEGKSEGEVEVTYSAGDILALNLAIWRFWASVIAAIAALLVVAPIVLLLISGYPPRASIAAYDWSFAGLILLILVGWLLAVSLLGYGWRRWQGLHGPILFALTETGVSFRNRQLQGSMYWDGIKAVRVRGGRIFVFAGRRSALIIPRRAFDGDGQFQAWADRAQGYWRAARGPK